MNITSKGDNFFRGTAGPGTTVVSNIAATVKRIVWGGSYVGTINVHDVASAGGTTATSSIVTLGIPLLRYPDSLEINLHCKNGIVVEETGTPIHTIIWGQ
mgnify:FL=1